MRDNFEELGIVRFSRYIEGRDRFADFFCLDRNLSRARTPPRDGKPIIIIATSRTDHNGAFALQSRTHAQFLQSNHAIFIEGESSEHILEIILRIRANYIAKGYDKKFDGLCLQGHANHALLEGGVNWNWDAEALAALSEVGENFAPGFHTVLMGCKTASRKRGADSIADLVRNAIPHGRVVACREADHPNTFVWEGGLYAIGSAQRIVFRSVDEVNASVASGLPLPPINIPPFINKPKPNKGT